MARHGFAGRLLEPVAGQQHVLRAGELRGGAVPQALEGEAVGHERCGVASPQPLGQAQRGVVVNACGGEFGQQRAALGTGELREAGHPVGGEVHQGTLRAARLTAAERPPHRGFIRAATAAISAGGRVRTGSPVASARRCTSQRYSRYSASA